MAGTILTKYAPRELSIEDKARFGCLPERLTLREIACLIEPDESRRKAWLATFGRACNEYRKDPQKSLAYEWTIPVYFQLNLSKVPDCILRCESDYPEGMWESKFSKSSNKVLVVHRDDFRRWLEQEGKWPLSVDCLLSRWWNSDIQESLPQTEPEPKVSGKTAQRRLVDKEGKTRADNLSRAIDAALLVLHEGLDRVPTEPEVFRYLADHDETDVIQDSIDEKLTWIDTRGRLHDCTHRNLSDRLTAKRKAG